MKFYLVSNKRMPWGDYGMTLLEGYSYEINESTVGIDRSGPFIPPATLSSKKLIITEQYRKNIEAYDLKGFSYKSCLKNKIVHIPWHRWPEDQDPQNYPAGGEPENYINGRKHNEKIAAQMPDLWELCPDNNDTLIGRIWENKGDVNLFLIENSWTGSDVFYSKSYSGHLFVTEKGRSVLEKYSEGFLSFSLFPSREGTSEEINNAIEILRPWWEIKKSITEVSDENFKIRKELLRKASRSISNAPKAKTEQGKSSRYSTAYDFLRKAHNIQPLTENDMEKLKIVLRHFKEIK